MQFTEKMRFEIELDNEERVFLLEALHGYVEIKDIVRSTDQFLFIERLLSHIDIDGAYYRQG